MIHVFSATYAAVLVAELVGDKFVYTTGVLATRYATLPIVCGVALAFMLKMGVAVAVGSTVAALPPALIASATGAGFIWMAVRFWRDPHDEIAAPRRRRSSEAAVVSFASVFLSEWADLGQLTAATLATRMGAPFVVWAGAVAAMMTKAIVAATIGARLRRWLHPFAASAMGRYASIGLLLLIGALSVAETLLTNP